ncbi:MAG: ATP-binding protein [Bacteroidetes bacterium]|nr:ATP-binding protein [Bacteroidota bacterium]
MAINLFELKESDIQGLVKPTAYAPNTFPYKDLDSRLFEYLVYELYKSEIENPEGSMHGKFDNIWLMEGVKEGGRDCSLFFNGKAYGVIQCKHSSVDNRIDKTAVAREILKFILHAINEPELIHDVNEFAYYFVVSADFTGKSRELLSDFNVKIFKEAKLEAWVKNIISSNKGLSHLVYENIETNLRDILLKIKLVSVAGHDLTILLNQAFNSTLITTFFEVRKVVDATEVRDELRSLNESIKESIEYSDESHIPVEKIVEQFNASSFYLHNYPNEFSGIAGSHIQRTETNELYEWIRTPLSSEDRHKNIRLLAGDSGLGKSVIMKDLFTLLASDGIPTLGIKADKYYVTSINDLAEKLNIEDKLEKTIHTLASSFDKVVILIDQIDALSQTLASNRDPINTFNTLVSIARSHENVRIVISVRFYDLNYDPDLQFYKKNQITEVQLLPEIDVKSVVMALGISWANIPTSLRGLLRVPNHLNIFSKIYSTTSKVPEIETLNDLYNELWMATLSRPGGDISSQQLAEVLKEIANEMYTQQQIDVSKAKFLLQYAAEIDYLARNGIIILSDTTLQFFHQSFYDYVFARSFIESNRPISQYILANKNSLFIRASLRMILIYLRDYDHSKYITTLNEILISDKFRFHVKLLVINNLGFQKNPTVQEATLVKQVLLMKTDYKELFIESAIGNGWLTILINQKLIDELLTVKPKWYDKMLKNNFLRSSGLLPKHWKTYEVREEDNINIVYRFFTRKLPAERDKIVTYLEGANDFKNKDAFCFRILYFVKIWDSPKIFNLFNRYKDMMYTDKMGFYHILSDVIKYDPQWVIQTYKPILFKEINNVAKFKQHSNDDYLENDLFEKLFEKDYLLSFDFGLEVINEYIKRSSIAFDQSKLFMDYHFTHFEYDKNRQSDGLHNLYQLAIDALKRTMTENKPMFTGVLVKYKNSNSEDIINLILYAFLYSDNSNDYSDDIFEILNILFHKEGFYAEGKLGYLILTLLKKAYPSFNTEQQRAMISLIQSIKINELHIDTRDNKKRLFSFYGYKKYQFLCALPESTLKRPEITREYQELVRRFGKIKVEEPGRIRVHRVGPPLRDTAYKKMTFENWRSSFRKYDSEKHFHGFPSKGSMTENHREFTEQVSKDTARFAPFVDEILDESIHPDYKIAGLEGLVKGKINVQAFLLLFKKAIRKEWPRFNILQLVWMTDYLIASRLVDDEVIDFLINAAINNSDPESDKPGDDGLQRGINTVRGAAVYRLVRINFYPAFATKIFNCLNQVCTDSTITVRTSLISQLAYMMNLDKERTLEIFQKLTANYDFQIYKHSIWSATYLSNYSFERLQEYYLKAIAHSEFYEDLTQPLVFAFLNRKKNSYKLLKRISKDPTVKAKIVDAAAHNLIDENNSVDKRAARLFCQYLNLDSKEIGHVYSVAFIHLEPKDFEALYPLIYKFSRSKNGKTNLSYYYDYLLKCVNKNALLVLKLMENISEHEHSELSLDDDSVRIVIALYNVLSRNSHNTKNVEQALALFDQVLYTPQFRKFASKIIEEVER